MFESNIYWHCFRLIRGIKNFIIMDTMEYWVCRCPQVCTISSHMTHCWENLGIFNNLKKIDQGPSQRVPRQVGQSCIRRDLEIQDIYEISMR